MINVNFGWLNDYSGSKFAPFTLADKVLLNTEHNTTESFYDYVKSQNDIINKNLNEKGLQIKELQAQMHGLIDPPESLEVTRLFVQEAYSLVDSANTKTNVGALNTPIYFKDGRPAICNDITRNSYQSNSEYIPNDRILGGKDLPLTVTTYSYTYQDSLNVNISGIAEYARRAEDCNTTRYSDGAGYAEWAMKAHTLSHDVNFIGDVTGTLEQIQEANNYFNGDVNVSLDLQKVLKITTDGGKNWTSVDSNTDFGGANNVSVNIPALTIDPKGRIVKAQNIAWTPTIPVTLIEQANTKTFPLLTAIINTSNNTVTSYHASDSTANGVYIEKLDSGLQILMGAAWNDYAEFRNQAESIEPGYCVASYDNGKVYKTTEKLQACDGIVSDTFGFSIGKTEKCQTPLAVSGRVLAYYEGNIDDYHSGDTVCAGPNGKICKMTREEIKEYPDRIVGIVSEIPTYEKWNNIYIKNRIWIKVR